MESVLIVDDARIEREGIRDNIDWAELGIDRVEIAADGQQALQLIEQTPPSILLTDICMPFMDGLDLCKATRSIDPTIKVVILTGHDEFPYAQQAVRLGASELLLKPITAEELSKILKNLTLQIGEERASRRDLERLKAQMQQSIPVLRERFLIRFLQGRFSESNWDEQSATLGIQLLGNRWLVLAIKVDHWGNVLKTHKYEQTELLLLAIETICREYIGSFKDCLLIHGEDDSLHVIVGDDNPGFEAEVFSRGRIIRKIVADNLGVTITIGVGHLVDRILAIPGSHRDALTALGYRLLLGGDRLISIADMEPERYGPVTITTEFSHRLATIVRTGAVKKVDPAIEELVSFLSANRVPVPVCHMVVMHAITEILEAAYELNGSQTLINLDYKFFNELQRSATLDEVGAWLNKVCKEMASSVHLRRETDIRIRIEQAKQYIIQNFADPELSLQEVCQQLHVSPSYFSVIFKRETGNTFLGFLTEYRIRKAKELLLATTLKGYQIAEQVGYLDPNYFSVIFRKHCNLTPQQFREKRGAL